MSDLSQLTIRFTDEQLLKLTQEALETDRALASVVRVIVNEFFKNKADKNISDKEPYVKIRGES